MTETIVWLRHSAQIIFTACGHWALSKASFMSWTVAIRSKLGTQLL